MLSFSEKRKLQKIVKDGLAGLDTGLSFSEKRRVQKEIADALAKLNATIDQSPDKAAENQKLADLIAGKFNGEEPERFLAILKEIVAEIQDIEPVKEPTIRYIEVNKDKAA
ncbi:MAG: hypothetical protein ABIL58_23240 [Pseudomonadota bacterium]